MVYNQHERPYGSVAAYIEQFREYTETRLLDSAVLGSVEAAVIISTSDTTTMRRIRAALTAADIVRGEQRTARDFAMAELSEQAEPSQLAPPSDRAANMAGNRRPAMYHPMGGGSW